MKRSDIAEEIGVPESRLKRAASFMGWKFSYTKGFADSKYDPEVVKEVCRFYEKNGRKLTEEKFHEVNVRSIVERYKNFSPRQSRWLDSEVLEVLRMACFIPYEKQAEILNRPLANAGSIVSVWQKKLKCKPVEVHGLPDYKMKMFIKKKCPFVKLPSVTSSNNTSLSRKLYLWVDIEEHLYDEVPDFFKIAVRSLALFQRKLFNGNTHLEIEKMLKMSISST
ncbi:MAG: hypothetical protein ACPGJV_02665 [Bacteriovoracaceae bacterium]